MPHNNTEIMRLLQFTDSTFPVGTFSFSNGLETAGLEKIVHDKPTLRDFVKSQALQAAFTWCSGSCGTQGLSKAGL